MNGTFIAGAAGILSALSYLCIFAAICVVAARRELPKKGRSLAIFAVFLLFAGVNPILALMDMGSLSAWWGFATALLSVRAAVVIIINLPQSLPLPKSA